jgi:hypothetical protein
MSAIEYLIVVELDWKFSPPDYFEQVIEILRQNYTMTIADGQAHAKIDSAIFEANPGMREELHNSLNDRFLGVQLLTHRAYELSRSTMTRVHPGGRREILCELETGRYVITGNTVDFRVTGKDGSVIADSKRDRIEKKTSLAESIASHRSKDTLLASLLRSYAAAVRDPNNELVYLYEIRDALSAKFGGENATRSALGISKPQWSRFGHLCNEEPLRQGRHRGKTGGVLRDATEGELIEARGIARAMIEAHLQYLEASTSP